MKIALDVDGVLADIMASWLEHNNKIRTEILRHEITAWDFWKKFDIDRYDFYAELNKCWENWPDIPPTEVELSDSTRHLSKMGQVDIVTARDPSTDSFVKEWLGNHNIAYENYVSVASGSMKADLNYDIFIDDSPLNAMKILQNKKRIFLYDQPWNQKVMDERIHRVSSLFQIIGHLTLK